MQFSLNKPALLGQTQLILIDGPAGAGKTTLADKLSKDFDAKVIHLEYLYDGWENALTPTLTEKLLELCNSLANGQSHTLPVYDWHEKRFIGIEIIEPSKVLIIEGVGAGQSAIRGYSSALIWVDVDPQLGFDRVIARDGESIREEIIRWKIREAEHFAEEQTRHFADFYYSTS